VSRRPVRQILHAGILGVPPKLPFAPTMVQ
jgi:hypothetical protein